MKSAVTTAVGTIGPRLEVLAAGGLRPESQALVDPTVFINGYLDVMSSLTGRVADHGSRLGKDVAGALLDESKVIATELRDHALSLSNVLHEQVTQADAAAKEQADALDRELRRERAAERREARSAAAAVFEDMTKAELQAELEKRDLEKTGTVDELRARLIDAELASAAK